MSVKTKTKTMSSSFLLLSLFFLILHDSGNAFNVDKPMVYINFFEDVGTENASSNLTEKGLSTIPPQLNNTKDIKREVALRTGLPQGNNGNKISNSASFDPIYLLPSKADIPEISVNGSVEDQLTTTKAADLMDPKLLEPELTRMFFLRAITSLIEHLMLALFTIDEPPMNQRANVSSYDDYDSSASRNLKKRDVLDVDGMNNLKGENESFDDKDLKTGFGSVATGNQTIASDITNGNVSSGLLSSSNSPQNSENSSPSTSSPDRASSLLNNYGTVGKNSHPSKRENEPSEIAGLKSGRDSHILLDRETLHHRKLPVKAIPTEEDEMKLFHFTDENSVIDDEITNNKEPRLYDGVFTAEERMGLMVRNVADKGEEKSKSSFVVTVFLIGTTVLVLMVLGALAMVAGYFFRRNQESVDHQNASDINSTVA